MPTALIAGIPIAADTRLGRALRRGLKFRGDWEIRRIRSHSRSSPGVSPTNVTALLEAVADPDVVTLLMFTRDGEEKQRLRPSFEPFFRIIWPRRGLLQLLHSDVGEFIKEVNSLLQCEEEWTSKVKPQDHRSPLVLPECSFVASVNNRRVWRLALEFGDTNRIEGASRAIGKFWRDHYTDVENTGRRWIDSDDRVFDHTGPSHGKAQFPRNWKFSYALPQGFHFDVTHRDGRAFGMIDCHVTRHVVAGNGYLNVDPHGHVTH